MLFGQPSLVVPVDVEQGQQGEEEGFEHGGIRSPGPEGEEQVPELGRHLREGEGGGAGGVEDQGEGFEEVGDEEGRGVRGIFAAGDRMVLASVWALPEAGIKPGVAWLSLL